jgi:DNA-binding protein Fis
MEQSPFLDLVKSVPEQYRELTERKERIKEICRAEICALERRFAEALVARASGNVTKAAQLAGIDRGQFHRLLKSGS